VPRTSVDGFVSVSPPYLLVSNVMFNGHQLTRYVTGNVSSYFLRLPSGNWGLESGRNGYPSNQMVSLAKLQAGEIATITAVDQSATYESWQDLRETITAVLTAESDGAQEHPWINTRSSTLLSAKMTTSITTQQDH